MAGIDAGKTALELPVAAGPARSCANTADGIADSVDGLAGCWHGPVNLVECEPTGGYEKPSVAALRAAGTPTLKAHPNRVRACGALAKTVRLDAQALSRYCVAFAPPPRSRSRPPADGEATAEEARRKEIQDLRRRREQPVNQRTQEKNRQDNGQSAGARASAERHIAWLVDEITRPNKEYQALLSNRPALAEPAFLYSSAPGIGILMAAAPVAGLPEPGHADSRSLAGLVGAAPRARGSGRQRG